MRLVIKALVSGLAIVCGWGVGFSYYKMPLSWRQNKFLDETVVKLEEHIQSTKGLTRGEVSKKLKPVADEYEGSIFGEMVMMLYNEALLRSRYKVIGYAKAVLPTPVLSTPNFAETWGGSPASNTGFYGLRVGDDDMIDTLLAVLLPGSVFTIYGKLTDTGSTIYAVYTREVPPPPGGKLWYIDSRFVERLDRKPPERGILLPSQEEVLNNLLAAEGKRYVRGSTYSKGIPELKSRYPYPKDISEDARRLRELEGVDCSGLLYEATQGATPRNSALLVEFGQAVDIEGKRAEEIIPLLEPLDIIAWKGHAMIVLNKNDVIESRHDYEPGREGYQGGVKIRPLSDVIRETMKYYYPVNDYYAPGKIRLDSRFVVRRRYDSALAQQASTQMSLAMGK